MTTSVPAQATAPPTDSALDRLIERLAARAGALGVVTHRVATLDEVAAFVADLAARGQPQGGAAPGQVAIAPGLDAARPALRQGLAAHEAAVGAVDPADPGGSFAGVAVGVSEAIFGIAETGSLVVADTLVDRLVRMLAPTHVVVLDAANVLPDLDVAGERLRERIAGGLTPYVSFITGPSRTADIEMSLTVGAHGPAELHIAVLGAAAA